MIPRDLYFANPQAILHILWIIPLAGIFWLAVRKNQQGLKSLAGASLLPLMTTPPNLKQQFLTAIYIFIGWSLIVMALMQPQSEGKYASAMPQIQSLELYILIDASQSMGVTDAKNHMRRFDRALEIVDQLLTRLTWQPIALNTFTNSLNEIVPLTYDKLFVRLLLKELQLNEGDQYGTNYLETLQQLLKQELLLYPNDSKIVLMLSDGGDNSLEDLRNTPSQEKLQPLRTLAGEFKAPIFTIGIGSQEGGKIPDVWRNGQAVISKLNEFTLQTLSTASQGEYLTAGSQTAQEIAESLIQAFERYQVNDSFKGSKSHPLAMTNEYFQIPLLLGSIFFILAFLRSYYNQLFILLFFMFPHIAQAKDTGEKLYESKHYSEAIRWYRGELSQANERWLQDKLFYNLGLSLLADGKASESLLTLLYISPAVNSHPQFLTQFKLTLMLALDKLKSENAMQALFALSRINQTSSHLEKEAKSNTSLATFLLQQTILPAEFLKQLLNVLANVKFQYDLSMPLEIDIVKEAEQFFAITLAWQNEQFKQGLCQCLPWNQVLPLFSEGVFALKQGLDDRHFIIAYLKWTTALDLLIQPISPHVVQQKIQEEQTLSELQNMQMQDREPSSISHNFGEGMPW